MTKINHTMSKGQLFKTKRYFSFSPRVSNQEDGPIMEIVKKLELKEKNF
jgi:hypothetical protein